MHSAKLFSAAFAGLSLLSIAVAAPQLGRSKLPKINTRDAPLKIRDDGWDIYGDDKKITERDSDGEESAGAGDTIHDDDGHVNSRGLPWCCTRDKGEIPDGSVCDTTC